EVAGGHHHVEALARLELEEGRDSEAALARDAVFLGLRLRQLDHLRGDVDADDARSARLRQRQRVAARAAADVEHGPRLALRREPGDQPEALHHHAAEPAVHQLLVQRLLLFVDRVEPDRRAIEIATDELPRVHTRGRLPGDRSGTRRAAASAWPPPTSGSRNG